MIDRMRRRIANVEPTLVVADCLQRVQIFNRQLSERLIILREMSLHLPLQTVSLTIILPTKSLTDSRNRLMCIGRIHIHVARFTRPQRDVIQRNLVRLRSAIDDATHRTVANRKGFFKILRWTVVVQGLRVRLHHCQKTPYRYQKFFSYHWSRSLDCSFRLKGKTKSRDSQAFPALISDSAYNNYDSSFVMRNRYRLYHGQKRNNY